LLLDRREITLLLFLKGRVLLSVGGRFREEYLRHQISTRCLGAGYFKNPISCQQIIAKKTVDGAGPRKPRKGQTIVKAWNPSSGGKAQLGSGWDEGLP